jgi:trans-aconitate 2-methyltransferase
MRWDPQQYGQFSDERSRPFFDLIGRIRAESPQKVVDLGCGAGELTVSLADRWPAADILGIDNSFDMIDRARMRAGDPESVQYELGDISTWQPDPETDVITSNAALQWVSGHREMIPVWLDSMPEGAWIGWQVPGNFTAPSHVLMRQLAESEAWSSKLAGVLRHTDVVAEPTEYLQLLLDNGWTGEAWETTYLHRLTGENPVLEWVRGSGLRPVLAALEPDDAAEFERQYTLLINVAYPQTNHGTFFPFRRIFCVGTKA